MQQLPPVTGEKPNESVKGRVLDTTIEYYSNHGFSRPGIDEIARAAGLSAEDVTSHFASEERLRQACDESVLRSVVGWAREKATLEGMSDVMRSYLADSRSYQMHLDYLGRVVAEDTPAAERFIDVLVDESEVLVDESETTIRAGIMDGTMRSSDDPRALAVFIAATALA